MADDATKTGGTGTTETKTAPDAKTGEGQSTTFDINKLDDEGKNKVLEFAFNHPRFKELTTQAQEYKKYKEEQAQKEEERMKEQNKYKELWEKEKTEKQQILSQRQQDKVDSEIKDVARQLGAVDPNAVLKLLDDRSTIKLDDTGKVSGVEDAVKKLLEASPYLKGDGKTKKIGDGTNPSGGGEESIKRFKASQLKDPVFFRENEADIMKAFKNNWIEDDQQQS